MARLVYAVRTQGKEYTERGNQGYSLERYRQRVLHKVTLKLLPDMAWI